MRRRPWTTREDAARDGDVRALAAARGAFAAAVLRGSAAVTLSATDRGEAAVARRWLLLRDFRTATRFTRPGADATLAIERLGEGRVAPKAAHTAVVKDLLDGYQARMRELLDDANAAAGAGSRRAGRGRRPGGRVLADPRASATSRTAARPRPRA